MNMDPRAGQYARCKIRGRAFRPTLVSPIIVQSGSISVGVSLCSADSHIAEENFHARDRFSFVSSHEKRAPPSSSRNRFFSGWLFCSDGPVYGIRRKAFDHAKRRRPAPRNRKKPYMPNPKIDRGKDLQRLDWHIETNAGDTGNGFGF